MADESLDRILESLSQITTHLECLRIQSLALAENQSDHETRLRSIEQWKYGLSPFFTLLAFALGAASNALLEHF
jgi:hypothetical protein